MGMYRCEECDEYRDSDDGCHETAGSMSGLMCESCYEEAMEESSSEAYKARQYEIEQRLTNESLVRDGEIG